MADEEDYSQMDMEEAEEKLQQIIASAMVKKREPLDISAEELLEISKTVLGEDVQIGDVPFIGDISREDLRAPLTASERMARAAPRSENKIYFTGDNLFGVAESGVGDGFEIRVWDKTAGNPNNPFFRYEDGELIGIYDDEGQVEMMVPQIQPLGVIKVDGIEFTGGLEDGTGDEDFAWRLGME